MYFCEGQTWCATDVSVSPLQWRSSMSVCVCALEFQRCCAQASLPRLACVFINPGISGGSIYVYLPLYPEVLLCNWVACGDPVCVHVRCRLALWPYMHCGVAT